MSPLFSLFTCLLIVAVPAQSEPTIQDVCPSNLVSANRFYLQVYNGICYQFFVHQRKTFKDANDRCEQDGGMLAMPLDLDTNNFLARTTFEHYGAIDEVWIGLSDLGDENKYMWVDGSPLNWKHFAKGNGPQNNWLVRQFEDCVALDPLDGFWHDFLCNDDFFAAGLRSQPKKSFICQYDAGDDSYSDDD